MAKNKEKGGWFVGNMRTAWVVLAATSAVIGLDVATFTENADYGILAGLATLIAGAVISDRNFGSNFRSVVPGRAPKKAHA